MVSLEDLATEILVEVFKYLTREKAILRYLTTANKRMSVLAIQTLACNIDICVQTEDNALSRRYDLLMASLDRSPELRVLTREITIRCEERGERRRRSEHPNIRANILLRRLTKIRSLSIDWHDQTNTFAPAFLEHKEHCLKEVTFLAGKTSPEPAGLNSPRLKVMDLGRTHFATGELRRLFENFPTITTVDCGVPFTRRHLTPSPENVIAQAFAPLREGLVNLRLRGEPIHTLRGSRHLGPMDLTDLRCLKILHVTSTCYFFGRFHYQRTGMRILLPPSLEEFKVTFDFGNHFLYSKDEIPLCFPDGQYDDCIEVKYPERYAWLSELIGANLADPNFRLRKVMIEERTFDSRYLYYHRHPWKLPSALHQLCNDAEVTLEVYVRKPLGTGNWLDAAP